MLAIYTPTYNREKELFKLYNTLCQQTNKNFFWLVVDDGSTDSTEETVQRWVKESIIKISYVKKENGGKHTAINTALDIVNDYWNVCIDSDDWLMDKNSIDIVLSDIAKIKEQPDVISILYPYQFKNIELKNKNHNFKELKDCDPRDKKNGVLETTTISRPNAYGNNRFPLFENENFIAESALETLKFMEGTILYKHTPLVQGEYLASGLTHNIVNTWKKNPKGYYYVRNLSVKYYNANHRYIKALIPLGQMVALNIDLKKNIFLGIDSKYKLQGLFSIPLGLGYWFKKFKNN